MGFDETAATTALEAANGAPVMNSWNPGGENFRQMT